MSFTETKTQVQRDLLCRKNKRPIIAILTAREYIDDEPFIEKSSVAYIETNLIYWIIKNGGIPMMLPYSKDVESNKVLLDLAQGLVVPGGLDVDPYLYGEEPKPLLGPVDPEVDRHDYELIEYAIAQFKPIFGICRGMQMVNVVLGGTLYQDLSYIIGQVHSHMQSIDRSFIHHEIQIREDSVLNKILEVDRLKVNSFHHQAIKDLAPGLRCIAKSSDDIIEAVEGDFIPFIGVQFHPEDLSNNPSGQYMDRLFGYFISKIKRD